MEVEKIITLLSQTEDIKYSGILFESNKEKCCVIGAFISYLVFIFAKFFGSMSLALLCMVLSLIFLVAHSFISFVRDKLFLLNPIKFYSKELIKNINIQSELVQELSSFNTENIRRAKLTFEREHERINERIAFLIGASDKVGVFPSFLAIAYAFYEFNPENGLSIFASILVGISVGLYLGVLLLKRITSWQKECVNLLEDALKIKSISK
jgi:energy-coupling factor transporter transmembrane protein EcfT